MNLLQEYTRIVTAEERLQGSRRFLSFRNSTADMRWEVEQLREKAIGATVPRSYIVKYNLTDQLQEIPTRPLGKRPVVWESVAAHTNFVAALVDRALSTIYGPDFGDPDSDFPRTEDGFSYRVIMEAARVHDLAENVTGDIPDNSDRNNQKKLADEQAYFADYFHKYPAREENFKTHVMRLIGNMEKRYGPTGCLLYAADKAAAVLMALTLDSLGVPPMLHIDYPDATERDIQEMLLCDFVKNGYRRCSEMWTIDFFHIRELCRYDQTGFFTALIVMFTLATHGHWYDWREQDYRLIQS